MQKRINNDDGEKVGSRKFPISHFTYLMKACRKRKTFFFKLDLLYLSNSTFITDHLYRNSRTSEVTISFWVYD